MKTKQIKLTKDEIHFILFTINELSMNFIYSDDETSNTYESLFKKLCECDKKW